MPAVVIVPPESASTEIRPPATSALLDCVAADDGVRLDASMLVAPEMVSAPLCA